VHIIIIIFFNIIYIVNGFICLLMKLLNAQKKKKGKGKGNFR
jgi:hypothetical protein